MSATTSCARPAGCSEPSSASSSVSAGRFDSAANCMVSSIGAAISANPTTAIDDQHRGALAQIAQRTLGAHDLGDRHRGQHEAQQHRHLVAPERERGGDERKAPAPISERAALERELQQQQRQRKQPVAQDDAGVLQPAGGGAAEHEQHRRQHAGRPPASARARRSRRPQVRRSADARARGDRRRAATAPGSNSAHSTNSGAKISDCGSATLGCPP